MKKNKAKKDVESRTRKKVGLEQIERIAVIVGAALGVIAFFWQIYVNVVSQQEKVAVVISFFPVSKNGAEAIDGESLNAHIEVVNVSSRPIYMNSVFIQAQFEDRQQILDFSDNRITADSDPIESGARRSYNIAIDTEQMDYFVSFARLFLIAESSITELYKQDITNCYKESVDRWKSYSSRDSSFELLTYSTYFPYQCSQ
ncbi:MAG TPA: hypothetical protein PKK96_02420 [Anaerolineales bacterium]|nr:hypothetical protein [Anaerolineales bacterium]HNQ94007.1 hypothetical protein [Anaerolineales bacterium]HNS59834.1 hypothetical protein [Anaerolineales bacterium]